MIFRSTGIGPEAFAYFSNKGNITEQTVTPDDLAFYNEHGFFIQSGASYYLQRPEVLESNFYAWRVTGDTKYLDRAASAIGSFQKFLTDPGIAGFAPIQDVTNTNKTPDTNYYMDDTQSFWFAEVLKYLCVITVLCHRRQYLDSIPGTSLLTTPTTSVSMNVSRHTLSFSMLRLTAFCRGFQH